jgi:cell wall-associated NlpC family hydrolase
VPGKGAKEEVLTIKNLALGACLLLAGNALAEATHTIREGDTLSGIASKYGVGQKAILEANNLKSAHRLKVGTKLRIPTKSAKIAQNKSQSRSSANSYSVREGDNDWTIAKKFGITPKQLRDLNPGRKWSALQIGDDVRVPGKTVIAIRAKSPKSAVAAVAGSKYAVQEGDNDWIIAKRVGVTPSTLRKLNPGVNWSALQIGQKLSVPGHETKAASVPVIKTRYAIITGDVVAVRRRPNTSAAKVTSVESGEPVTLLDRESGWYKLRTENGDQGWVKGTYLKALSTQAVARAVKHADTRVAMVADTDGLSKKKKSTKVTPKKAAPKSSTRVAMKSTNSTVETLLEKANSFRGTRYSWGGMSRSATDCSGFTSQVFRAIGVKIPRTAMEQSGIGHPIPKGQLKPGDLVFFRTGRSVRINHVGIYIGSGHFIHASSGGGQVMESSLSEGYYLRCYATARRVAKLKKGEFDDLDGIAKDAEPTSSPVDGGPSDDGGN